MSLEFDLLQPACISLLPLKCSSRIGQPINYAMVNSRLTLKREKSIESLK
jgi:hypothetical protein